MSQHSYDYDLLVVGGGPGGYVAAIRAAQLGLKVGLVERENLGGVCLNWGCVPKKALMVNAEVLETLHQAKEFGFTFENLQVDYRSALKRSLQVVGRQTKGVAFLMRKNKIDVLEGHGVFQDPHTLRVTPGPINPEAPERTVTADKFILATGARARDLPGVTVDGERIMQYRHAIRLEQPPESLVIIGAGPIGMEFAHIFQVYGAQVTVVEMMDQILPLEDPEVAQEVHKAFRKNKVKLLTSARTESIQAGEEGVTVTVATQEGSQTIQAERALIAIGITPNTEKVGLEAAGVQLDERGFVPVDEVMRTNVPHIFAVGDCTGKMALAHVASAQGIVAAETMAGVETTPFPEERYIFMPRCVYCKPEVASFGMTEAQAKEAGYEINVGKFPFMPNGKAQAMGVRVGFVKIIADARYGEILGAHLVGPDVTELLPELTLAQMMELTPAEIARNVHAHPTLSEVIMEAAHGVEGHPIHM